MEIFDNFVVFCDMQSYYFLLTKLGPWPIDGVKLAQLWGLFFKDMFWWGFLDAQHFVFCIADNIRNSL